MTTAGWIAQDYGKLNLGAGLGVAVQEFQIGSSTSPKGTISLRADNDFTFSKQSLLYRSLLTKGKE
jgi:hypothetical protein